MDTIYGTTIAYAAPVFLAAVVVEILFGRLRRTRYYTLTDAVTSVGCGTSYIGARIAFGFFGLAAYDLVLRAAPVRLPGGHWGTWIFAFVLYDFCYYWWHRLSHTVAFLWASHVVHHQSEEFNLTTALRQPASGFLAGWIFYLPLALCGVPLTVYLAVGIVQLLYQFWPHTRHIGKLGLLDRWIQTPSNHRVHHARNAAYLDKNYVGVFLIWDRLFGTFQEEREDLPCDYGITEPVDPWNPAWANLHVFEKLVRRSWRTRRWTDKLRVWFAPPSWRPADITLPTTAPQRQDRARGALAAYAMVQFAAVLALNQHFLLIFPTQTAATNAAYFALVFLGLTTVSIVLECRREFFWLELARLSTMAALILLTGRWLGGVSHATALAGLLLFTAASLLWFAWLWARPAPAYRSEA